MSKQDQNVTYQVITQEDPETGDLLLPLPPPLLEQLGWKEGDNIIIDKDDKGRIIFRKT